LLLDSSLWPIYVHCLDGIVVTGIAVACLRKMQSWSIPACLNEFLRFDSSSVVDQSTQDFIEKYCFVNHLTDFEVPIYKNKVYEKKKKKE
jgi:tyrosine-protein phosphatase OCA6